MIAHQPKKIGDEALRAFRDRFQIPITDDKLAKVPFLQVRRRAAPRRDICMSAGRRLAAICPARRAQDGSAADSRRSRLSTRC